MRAFRAILTRCLAAAAFVALSLGSASTATRAAEPDSAHVIAEKFAAASGAGAPSVPDPTVQASQDARKAAAAAKKRAEAARAAAKRREQEQALSQRKSDEADMLARARAEAAEREADLRRAEEEVVAAEQRERQAAEQRERQAAEQRERQAAEQRERQAAVEQQRAKELAEQAAKDAEAKRVVAEREATERAEAEENARRAALVAQREAETQRLAERLREARRVKAAQVEAFEREQAEAKARSERDAAALAAAKGQAEAAAAAAVLRPAATASPTVPPPAAVQATPARTDRVSVLLVIDAGTYGIRRFDRTQADPVLCAGDTCYISQGDGKPAAAKSRALALGAGNTLGQRAGACRHKLACVFRGVELPGGAADLQPVDLHVLRHDRRESARASADPTCAVSNGRVTCAAPIRSATWQAWVIAEPVAIAAGDAALAKAVEGGLSMRAAAAD